MKNKQKIPFDLQFFAEESTESATEENAGVEADGSDVDGDEKQESVDLEQVLSELAAARAESAKFKASIDKLTHKNKELTSQLRQRMTSQEQEDAAKREQDEERQAYVAELEAFKHRTEAKDRYLMQGMSADLAAKAAEAEVCGDMDLLASIQKQHTEALIKEKQAEWLGTRPNINAGDGNAYSHMSRDEIMAIEDYQERIKAIALNNDLF